MNRVRFLAAPAVAALAALALAAPAAAQEETTGAPEIGARAARSKAGAKARKEVKPRREASDSNWTPPTPTVLPAVQPRKRPNEVAPADGGLPLPSGRTRQTAPQSGVGFDKEGNFGTGMKF